MWWPLRRESERSVWARIVDAVWEEAGYVWPYSASHLGLTSKGALRVRTDIPDPVTRWFAMNLACVLEAILDWQLRATGSAPEWLRCPELDPEMANTVVTKCANPASTGMVAANRRILRDAIQRYQGNPFELFAGRFIEHVFTIDTASTDDLMMFAVLGTEAVPPWAAQHIVDQLQICLKHIDELCSQLRVNEMAAAAGRR